MTAPRIVAFAARSIRASPGRTLLLSCLVALTLLVFMTVLELSRLSADGLDSAIESDVGQAGTYAVSIDNTHGLSLQEVAHLLATHDRRFADSRTRFVERLPAIRPDCPPYEALGEPSVSVMYDAKLKPEPLPFGSGLPSDAPLCFSGQSVPSSAAYLPSRQEQDLWGPVLFVDYRYRDVVLLASTQPVTFQVLVITGQANDAADSLRASVVGALSERAASNGEAASTGVTVMRKDTGQEVRRASEAIRIVYTVIAWGVLVLGGLAILISQLIVVRGRAWLFGLVRAMGARPRHVALLVVSEVGAVLLIGLAIAAVSALAAEPFASSYTYSAFGVEANLLGIHTFAPLLAGSALVLIIGSALPALRALRKDALDVLESGRG